MKIGFVLDDSLDSSDGVQQYVLMLGRWLTGKGHEVHYLVGETKRRDIAHIHSLCKNRPVRFNNNRMTMPRRAKRKPIKQLLKQEQFDVLHIQMPYSPYMAGKVIKLAPKKTVIVGTFHILPFGGLQRFGAHLLSWRLRRTTKRIKKVWSTSPPTRKFAAGLGIDSTVMPNPVEWRKFAAAKAHPAYKKYFTVVFLGRLVERKGCLEVIKAAATLVRGGQIPNLRVLIGGTGPQDEHLKRWVKRHNLGSVVKFVGFLPESKKPNFLATADLAVFPSLGGESFGIILLEAMAAKAGVVIAGNNPGYHSVLGTVPQSLVAPGDTTGLSRKILTLYKNPQTRRQLHAQQQQLVKRYDISVIGQKLLSYYQQAQR